ncbi:unnamed protein product [Rotaria sp. Silwood1]|nr:unnamed protein product [Rotaria sp. Silwood1]CAF0900599.1 unnamed protein product [Rotaria sp. Silwood1]CAF3349652.1 unnamed protein product [Rotaria sp. Silwood1]CAF3374002.1 unnamed protein product [Rotaria sp. Silwood1]CAF3390708.1 unnamed protein product [Rotaria sp. Silwood1]
MDTCQFSYISRATLQITTALGIERSWNDLRSEFGLSVSPLVGATYYKTISLKGPQLFAVDKQECVWYHDDGKWFRYNTATDIKYDTLNYFNSNRAQNELEDRLVFDMIAQQPEEPNDMSKEFE